MTDYELLDSGNGLKLERFGRVVTSRPGALALWQPQKPELWRTATAAFDRKGGLTWRGREKLPESWVVNLRGIRLKLSTTDFGHLGVFPETFDIWDRIAAAIKNRGSHADGPPRFLNLFAYSGGATLAAAKAGAECCHLDASKGMVEWARENAALNGLENAPVRWIVDDAHKFLEREVRRGRTYDAILLDPPSFGHGARGELYKIERDLPKTLDLLRPLLSAHPLFLILTCHTPGFSPVVLANLLRQFRADGAVESGEMLLTGAPDVFALPSGTWACWQPIKL
jgi:23S rRNA (cytosine1962-C5)-methyltransferase